MRLDVEQVNRLADGGHLIQLLGVFAQGWVLAYETLVGLKIDHVNLQTSTLTSARRQ